uniref:Thioredoxin-related transmembrane protein 1 n=1 Tax=Hucho hucho TaxID=62062 RepID=A0A4W5PMY4_9TELE
MAPLLDHKSGDAMLSSLSWRSKSNLLTCSLLLLIHLTLAKPSSLKEITDGDWEDILAGEWMIEFFAPWCPACQQLQPVWNEFADWGDDMGVNIAKVDVTEQPGLSGRFIITSLPTIYHCKDGVFRRYQGARTKDDLLSFIDEKKWQGIEPLTLTVYFLLFSPLQRCHNYLIEHLGIPVWGSYVIFGLATLFSGLVLGLILVFIADFVFPSRRFNSPNYYQKKQTMEQARLIQQLEEEQEADGEEDDDDDDDEDGEQEDVWRKRRASPEGRPEEVLRKRVVGNCEDQDEDS